MHPFFISVYLSQCILASDRIFFAQNFGVNIPSGFRSLYLLAVLIANWSVFSRLFYLLEKITVKTTACM